MVRKKVTIKDIASGEEADLVLGYIKYRKKKGLYTLVLVSGLPGTGKTSTCFRLGELITTDILGENKMRAHHIIDSFLALTKAIMNADPKELNVFVVEEVSVLFPSRRAMSGINVDLARLLDTARKKQVILLANAPIWKSIDSHMRALGNIYIETRKIYRSEKIVLSKFYRLQTDPRGGKTYTHCFKRDGRKVRRMFTRKPDSEQWNIYEGKKDDFMKKLYETLVAREEKRLKKEDKELTGLHIVEKPLTPNERKVYMLKVEQKLNQTEIAKVMGCTPSYISLVWQDLRKKLTLGKENGENQVKIPTSKPIR